MNKVILLVALLFAACTPTDRLARMQKNHPYLFTQKDSTEIRIDKREIVDTSFVSKSVDTFTFHTERSKTFIYRNYDTVWVKQDIEPCTTVIRTTEIMPNVPAARTFSEQAERWMMYIALGIILFLLIIRTVSK